MTQTDACLSNILQHIVLVFSDSVPACFSMDTCVGGNMTIVFSTLLCRLLCASNHRDWCAMCYADSKAVKAAAVTDSTGQVA